MKIARFLLQSMVIELSLCRTFPKCFKSLTNGKGNSFNKIGVISTVNNLESDSDICGKKNIHVWFKKPDSNFL